MRRARSGRSANAAAAVWIAVACMACGGGSGDEGDGGGGGIAPLEPTARLTQANAFDAAHVLVELGRIASLPELFVLGGPGAAEPGAGAGLCTEGGAVTHGFELDVRPTGVISDGDAYAIEYDACVDAGVGLAGRLELAFTTVAGDVAAGESFSCTLELDVVALATTDAAGSETLDAAGTSSASASDGVATWSQAGSGVSARAGDPAVACTLHEYAVTMRTELFEGGGLERSFQLQAVFEVSSIDGLLTAETSLELVASGDQPPHAGELLLRGGGGSSLRVVALDNTSVELQLDEDGDGGPDVFAELLWSQL